MMTLSDGAEKRFIASIFPTGRCPFCGRPPMADAGPHYCPESYQAALKARVAEAVRLLTDKGYTVLPPTESR